MTYQSTFKRYEFKYILESAQKLALMDALEGRMKIDSYGRTTIRNIYFDTDNFRLIRLSLDKPSYKEKLRVRSYKKSENDDEVFVELKKKCESIKVRLLHLSLTKILFSHASFNYHRTVGNKSGYFRSHIYYVYI